MTGNSNTDTHAIDQLRAILPAVDPVALTNADRRTLLLLVQVSIPAAGIE